MNFIRLQTRLNTDVYGAYRSLTNPEKIVKWLGHEHVDLVGDPFQSVIWQNYGTEANAQKLEFFLMKCASKTEYCTEVHLLIKFSAPMACTDQAYEKINNTSLQLLEALRKHFNKDWVIQDRDLTAGVFRQSF
ncbi:MAG TPA: hypothetical protein DCS67_10960 [Clostridiales bacterium UBA8960]|jgi:hypothetical protein|nr:hypothetical protein [Clostridiales bacterium UBA8960]